ncbi:alpha/beta hydrolase [Variovorax sp. GT1P44]|uniref:alpha/beta hydrolase n=1 Tax=Variovorax sp. GT1P44 TaxID=3443742 RepID=UPI003F44A057
MRSWLIALVAAACLAAGCASPGAQKSNPREVFFVGGTYVGETGKEVMRGAMYVEHLRPPRTTRSYPLVLISGTAQTAVNWMTTPDGRTGWAQYFVEQGYEVYLVDQPARGRSAWHPGIDGELRNFPVATVEALFTASSGDWPQARLHTQWPGTGRRGDPVFDQFYASQVEYVGSNVATQTAMQAAGVALLERIGPAVLITHSQAGPFGWLIADARPQLVKGIVAVEPQGPPIQSGNRRTAAWGVADIAMTYAPPITKASDLQLEQQAAADAPGLQTCWMQQEPARQLPRLRGIPIAVVATEASYHAPFDHCTVRWLVQAGAEIDSIRLADLGIHGNGHMVMLEKNNLDVAAVLSNWVSRLPGNVVSH